MVENVGLVEIACLRLAFGMIASLLILNPAPIPPRFFRVQFLVALGLIVVAAVFFISYPIQRVRTGFWDVHEHLTSLWDKWTLISLATSGCVCFLGCILWHVNEAPGGRSSILLTTLCLAFVLFFVTPFKHPASLDWWRLVDNYASAVMIGTAISAMLLGHSYLISPAMTIVPLQRMLMALAGALALRVAVACCGLYWWTAERPLANLETETLLWLSARWLLGILAPFALGWMSWETTRIRSTQSATGILYVVVIVTFLGELTSLLLLEKTGYPL